MIRASSVAIAEAIAVAVNSDTPVKAKDLVAGLNEQSYGSAAYGADFRDEIVRVTGHTTAHTAVQEATSDALAATIRGAFDTIKNYGVPFAKALSAEIGMLYTSDRLQQLAFSQLRYNYVNVDDPFFDSAIYPTDVKNTSLEFTSISLDALKRLEFSYVSEDDVKEFVNTQHPDVVEIMENSDFDASRAANSITDWYELCQLFVNKNEVFNFGQIKSLEINRLLKMYVVLTKMYAQEDPVKWLTKGTLADYRQFVNLLWNGMTRYLLVLKQVANAYKQRVVAYAEIEPVTLADHQHSDYSGARFISGNVQIFYTNQALSVLEDSGVSFNEWLVALQYARFNKVQLEQVATLADAAVVKRWAGEYYKSIDTALSAKAKAMFVKTAAARALKFLGETPLLNERIRAVCPQGVLIQDWFENSMGLEYEKAYYAVSKALAAHTDDGATLDSGVGDGVVIHALMGGSLVPVFLRALKCNLAAEIVEATYVSVELTDDIVAKRQRLHKSLIKLIVNNSIGRS